MEPLIAPGNDIVHRLASVSSLLVFDFDGTLAPIVADRDSAQLRPETSALLDDVARRYPCAILSGRAHDDVAARLGGAKVAHVIGNHGIEPSPDMGSFAAAVDRARPMVLAATVAMAGVDVEDKRFSLAIHFRAAADRAVAAEAIREVVRGLPVPFRIVDGDCVVNAVPAGAPNKGDAMKRLVEETRAELALFVGDDVTDEDVFALDDPRVVSLRVGSSSTSRAPWYLRDQTEIDALLSLLAASRLRTA